MVWVVAATASGQDIAAQAPPVAVPQVAWVVWLFLHAHCEPLHHFPKRWIAFRLPLIVNTFGHLSAISATFLVFMAAFSSQQLQNCTISHVFLSATNHHSSQ